MNPSGGTDARAPLVFVSYSSHDRDKLGPIVQLVRAMRQGSVFQDYLSILPGERWHERVLEAIEQAGTLLVFWCEHSAASEHVREEYEVGLAHGKEIIPILLDDTALPSVLSAFQWIDLRRPEPHGGLSSFMPGIFRRSGRHYYPKDELGEYHDWDYEEYVEDERKRRKAWDAEQLPRRQEVASVIARRLGGSTGDERKLE